MKMFTRYAKKTAALLLTVVLLLSCAPVALAESYAAFVSASSTTVYNEMSLKTKLAVVNKYTVVTVLNESGNVAAVRYGNTMKYMPLKALSRVSDHSTPCKVNAKTKVYKKATTSSDSVAIKKDTAVNLIVTSGSWALVEHNGSSGFIEKKYLTVDTSASVNPGALSLAATVSSSSISVYAEMSTGSKKLATLKQGIQVTVRAMKSGWAYIEYQGNYGYCQTSGLKPGSGTGGQLSGESAIIVANNTIIYKSASTSSTKLGTLAQGATVTLISSVSGWAYIEKGGQYGYCKAAAVSTSGVIPTPTPNMNGAKPATVSASSLKIYASQSTKATVLKTLKKGNGLNVLGISGSWAYVEKDGIFGYASKSGINMATATANPLEGYKIATLAATVVSSSAKVYNSASTSAKSAKVALGTNVTVTAYTTKWAYVKNGSSVGFMQIADLATGNYTTLKSGSTSNNVKTLEQALLIGGYFDAEPDKTYNTATTVAVKRFQAACGLSQTGNADATVLRLIASGKAPKCSILSKSYSKGKKGEDIKRIQLRLYTLRYLAKTTSVDGDYGSTTVTAIKMFQSANGLSASGTADKKTIAALYSTTAKKLPSGKTAADGAVVTTPTVAPTTAPGGSSVPAGAPGQTGGNQAKNSTKISSTLASRTSSLPSNPSAYQRLEYIIYVGQNQLGKPYVFGATGTSTFDCSGFTQYAFKKGGVSILRTAYQQGYNNDYPKISTVSSLKRGDLVFFDTISDSDRCDHVGIYLGAGWFIHASSGQHKVVVSDISSGYYNRVFSWGRRIVR